jgi:hypothetical protein
MTCNEMAQMLKRSEEANVWTLEELIDGFGRCGVAADQQVALRTYISDKLGHKADTGCSQTLIVAFNPAATPCKSPSKESTSARRIRYRARKHGFIARKGRKDGLWYLSFVSHQLPNPEKGWKDEEILTSLARLDGLDPN